MMKPLAEANLRQQVLLSVTCDYQLQGRSLL